MLRWAELRALCHATEVPDRVEHAVRFLGAGEVRSVPAEGHHGNPILLLLSRLEQDPATAFWERVATADRAREFRRSLQDRVDDGGVLHMRFDKQEAYQDRIALAAGGDVIDVAAKVLAYPARRQNVMERLREDLDRRCS